MHTTVFLFGIVKITLHSLYQVIGLQATKNKKNKKTTIVHLAKIASPTNTRFLSRFVHTFAHLYIQASSCTCQSTITNILHAVSI